MPTQLESTPTLPPLTKQSNKTLIVIMLGPPGAGKGTQASLIHKALEIPHISTGDLLRANIKEQTALGEKAQVFMNQGQLVPDSLILDMLFERVAKKDCLKGYILDGFPRTLTQAKSYQGRIEERSTVTIFNLHLSTQIIVERLAHRLTCKDCNAPYHTLYSPPKKPLVCDSCDEDLIKRPDDHVQVIENRLKTYHEQTAPLIEFYSNYKNFFTIDCSRSKSEIFEQIKSYLI